MFQSFFFFIYSYANVRPSIVSPCNQISLEKINYVCKVYTKSNRVYIEIHAPHTTEGTLFARVFVNYFPTDRRRFSGACRHNNTPLRPLVTIRSLRTTDTLETPALSSIVHVLSGLNNFSRRPSSVTAVTHGNHTAGVLLYCYFVICFSFQIHRRDGRNGLPRHANITLFARINTSHTTGRVTSYSWRFPTSLPAPTRSLLSPNGVTSIG